MGGRQELGISGYETGGQGRRPGDAPDHHVPRVGRGEDGSGLGGGETSFGDGHHRPQRRVEGQSQRHPLGRSQHETPVDGCCSLIGVSLHVGRDAKHPIGTGLLTGRPQGGGRPGDIRGRR